MKPIIPRHGVPRIGFAMPAWAAVTIAWELAAALPKTTFQAFGKVAFPDKNRPGIDEFVQGTSGSARASDASPRIAGAPRGQSGATFAASGNAGFGSLHLGFDARAAVNDDTTFASAHGGVRCLAHQIPCRKPARDIHGSRDRSVDRRAKRGGRQRGDLGGRVDPFLPAPPSVKGATTAP